MLDLSYKDKLYFVDESVFNCPFCKRRNISYSITDSFNFNWSLEKKCYGYIVECSDCGNESLHLSFYNLATKHNGFFSPAAEKVSVPMPGGGTFPSQRILKNPDNTPMAIDDAIFHKQPTSYFTIDSRIPEAIRKPLNEADNCRNNNFLTGGSACLRKAIFELLKVQNIPKKDTKGKLLDYDERIKLFKQKLPTEDVEYCDILSIIKGVTSDELHEDSFPDFDNPTLRLLIETTKVILHSIYIEPDEKKRARDEIGKLRQGILGKQKKSEPDGETTVAKT